MLSIDLFIFTFHLKKWDWTYSIQLHLLLSKTFLFDQAHFSSFYRTMDHKNDTCNQQQQVYEVLQGKPFADIHSAITSLKPE